MGSVLRLAGLFFGITLICAFANGQDLGSSNKLFGGSKAPAATKSASPKKKAAVVSKKATSSKVRKSRAPIARKVKPTVPAAETTAKKSAAASKPEKRSPETKKPEAETKSGTAGAKVRPRIAGAKESTATAAKKTEIEKRTTAKTPARSSDKAPKKEIAKKEAPPNTVDARFKSFGPTKKVETKVEKAVAAKAEKAATAKIEKTITASDRQRYERLIEEGVEARSRRNYAAAENAFSQAKALVPNDPRALRGLGAVYADRDRWEDAEAAYRSAVEIDPKDASSQVALSYVLAKPLPVNDLFDRYERSEKAARAATQLAPRNALAFDQLGTALELKGLVGPETENAYRRAKELDPSFAPAYAHLARLLRRRGMAREADAEYQRAIDRAKDAPTRVLVAEVMQSELRFEDSEKLLRNALAEDPRNYQALLLLGRALGTQRKFDESEQMLRRAADLSPNAFSANSMLASIYLQQGKLPQAEGALFNAQRWAPASEKNQLARQFESVGDAYQRMGKRSDAARVYRIAKTLNSESPTLAGKLTATLGR